MIRDYMKRCLFCTASLALFALGNTFGVKAGVAGSNAWITLSLGISGMTDMSFGTATLLVSAVIIAVDLLGRGQLGLGTLLNALLIPVFSDLFLALFQAVPEASGMIVGAAYTLIGQTIISFATIFYMLPALGAGPRDTLMIIIGRRFPSAPIGLVKFALESAALLVGIVMGAPFGLGTVLVMVLQASIFQFACRMMRYEPRSVTHENLLETCAKLAGKAK